MAIEDNTVPDVSINRERLFNELGREYYLQYIGRRLDVYADKFRELADYCDCIDIYELNTDQLRDYEVQLLGLCKMIDAVEEKLVRKGDDTQMIGVLK